MFGTAFYLFEGLNCVCKMSSVFVLELAMLLGGRVRHWLEAALLL